MRDTDLPSPGELALGHELRRVAANAISGIQITSVRTPGGKLLKANKLKNFFDACSAALAGMLETAVPTVVAYTAPTATPNDIVVVYNRIMSGAPLVGAFAVGGAPARTVSAVSVSGNTVRITTNGAVTPGTHTIAYTQGTPVGEKVKDEYGLVAANYAAQATVAA